MPDLDLLQITHHTCTAVSSTLPGIIFKIPGQDGSPKTKFLEHSQSHSTESIWHTNSESELYLVLGSTRHQTNGVLSFLFLPFSLFLCLSFSFSLSQFLSLCSIKSYFFERNMDALTFWAQSLLEGSLGSNISYTWAFFRYGPTCGEHWLSLMMLQIWKAAIM